MGIHEDAQQGTLTGDTLARYLQSNPNILNEQDPATGRAPLATAAVAGFADEVEQLLKRGAKPDALSRDGETALLLATRETPRNLPRIVQLLISKTPAGSVDATPSGDGNTPLMYAVLREDIESIKLLAKAGASVTATNNSGLSAEQMAAASSNKAVARALDPEKEKWALGKLADTVVSFLRYIVAWVNKTANGIANRLFGLNPTLNDNIDEAVNDGETPNKAQFLENVDEFVKNSPLERFFKGNPNYIQELAKKATELKDDPNTPLGQPDLLPKTIKVTLHQQVIYCDDSSSMKRDGRWDAQVQLVKKIAQITTRVLPEGDGVALRFINQDVNNSETLSFQEIGNIVENMSWKPKGDTPIGTNLKSKILEPMVYSKLQPPALARPLLISVITDGMPSQEKDEALVEAIKECGDKLTQAGYPRESVKFMIGQIGTAKSAAAFLEGVGKNQDIADMVFVTSEQLDERLSAFKANESDLDRWLIETLFSPIKNY
ncbi:putative ankyrin repeat protein [Mycena sanguinolenta]|uniref:Putative ankyrin repeat protein n=1 Tax=Mycena sanguinolenta TaxID=230812 RepID=A0A8H6YHC5_9AGAR|nr:putative ankyrin repeat protein [Mycena sanguinolenta]